MKLIRKTVSRLSLILSAVLLIWAVFFYFAMINEVNDEIDDSLEDYARELIVSRLSGDPMPIEMSHTNNQYYLSPVSREYAAHTPHINYLDSMIYIPSKREKEPARIMTLIYKDAEEQYYELSVYTPTIEKQDLIAAILFWVVFLYISLLIIIVGVSVWVYEHNNRPLYRLLKWLDAYQVGAINNPVLDIETDISEFRRLNEAALRHVSRSEEVYLQQKEFVGNVSHELQTPVAVSLSRLEALMQDESFSEVQLNELAKTYQSLNYLKRLNQTLLLLYRVDSYQFVERSSILVNSLVADMLDDYQEIYASSGLSVDLQSKGELRLEMNEVLCSVLISNLLKNSFVHNHEGGIVSILITPERLLVSNTGSAIPLDGKIVFDRFYKGEERREGSVGLGLALVRSICEQQGLSIRYYWEDGLHHFELTK